MLKALFDRPKHWVDIDSMLAADSVDTDDALAWVARLLGADSLPHARLREAIANARTADPDADAKLPNVWRNLA